MNAEIIINVVATALASTIAFCGGLAIAAVILSKRRHRKPPFRQHITWN